MTAPALSVALASALAAAAVPVARAGLRLLSPDARRVQRLIGSTGSSEMAQLAAMATGLLDRLAHTVPARFGTSRGDRLAAAGLGEARAVARYRLACWLAPPIGAVAALLAAPGLLGEAGTEVRGLASLTGLAAGIAAPRLWLANRRQKRLAAIAARLPDAFDLLLIAAEAGLSIDAALARVGRDLAPTAPLLAAELSLTAIELGFLPTRADAWESLERRVPLPAVRALVDLLQQTDRYGTPLGRALRIIADEQRETALMALEERAARLPAILTVPMVLFILPPLFIVLIGPAALQLLASPVIP
jgi:tight adherence protein C